MRMGRRKRMYNQYKSEYRPEKSILDQEVYNRFTKKLTELLRDPVYYIYMVDNRYNKKEESVQCPLIYAGREIGNILVDTKTNAIIDIDIYSYVEFKDESAVKELIDDHIDV